MDEQRTVPVELTALELGMLLRVCDEKRQRGAEADDLFLYDVALPVVANKFLAVALVELDEGGE